MSSKDIIRNVLIAILTIGAYMAIRSAYELELASKLTVQYAGVVGIYLGVWGYVTKWHFNTKVGVND